MNWWQRLAFSILSLIAGWFSFDYLLMASRYMGMMGKNQKGMSAVWSLFLGVVMLVAFFVALAIYLNLIKKLSKTVNVVPYEKFDPVLQGGILATGFFLRFFFIMVIYLPRAV